MLTDLLIRKGLTFLMLKICNQFRLFFHIFWTAFSKLFFFNNVIDLTLLFPQEWELAENLQGVLEYQTRCGFHSLRVFANHGNWFKPVLVLCLGSQVRFRDIY